ncbi:spore germination protein KA [Neobacillus bataviensis]|uniref:Spore germination protein KA n=1 Tax=Neobacillus bataviensis TaxID=220685 RepID=A0A561DNI1_9BACI|nr:spore germination protein [Neobacillus bataviensis]TWE04923.1 spore germination protein KA [Neobacillus bataviensis]
MKFLRNKNKQPKAEQQNTLKSNTEGYSLEPNLENMLHKIKQEIGDSPDLVIRSFQIGSTPSVPVGAVYISGLTDEQSVNEYILRSLMVDTADSKLEIDSNHVFDLILNNALTIGNINILKDWNELIFSILSGDTIILIDGFAEAISGSTRGGQWRAITESSSQVNIRGPKDSFNESIATNIALIRRHLKSPQLRLETIRIGNVSQTNVAIMYLKGIVSEELVQEVRQRLTDIQIDAVLESGYLEEFIQDQTFTPFPTIYNTERPDAVSGNLLEGRIAVLVDGTPFVLIVPTVFTQFFQATEDYYQRSDIVLLMRLIRYTSFFVLLLGPSFYIAVTTYHPEMLPTSLLINIMAQREGVPFPALIEAVIMEATFEVLREAGIRMPRAVGQAVSIVGAIVLGQAAVEAGVVTGLMVIVVAITGIASFAVPSYNLTIAARMIRFPLMIISALLGFYGLTLAMILLVAHMNSLRSFGIPYLAPFTPFSLKGQKDTVIRASFKSYEKQSRFISQKAGENTQTDELKSPASKSKK